MRAPNNEEMAELLEFHVNRTYEDPTIEDWDMESEYIKNIWSVVFEDYISDGPGYAGRLMVVAWGGGPSFVEVFIWEHGKITKVELEI